MDGCGSTRADASTSLLAFEYANMRLQDWMVDDRCMVTHACMGTYSTANVLMRKLARNHFFFRATILQSRPVGCVDPLMPVLPTGSHGSKSHRVDILHGILLVNSTPRSTIVVSRSWQNYMTFVENADLTQLVLKVFFCFVFLAPFRARQTAWNLCGVPIEFAQERGSSTVPRRVSSFGVWRSSSGPFLPIFR